ncbi:hypothetical protein TWF788_003897 [Orbilia oligospora]|uniref:Uncharacterized protein n=1 Tax=Orbilia oligospora TaxID=2813651 RepID=A0A7C8TYA6_ORBOL|nr:hypothetical protein TWF788_003897 [Orbilia oligospora]
MRRVVLIKASNSHTATSFFFLSSTVASPPPKLFTHTHDASFTFYLLTSTAHLASNPHIFRIFRLRTNKPSLYPQINSKELSPPRVTVYWRAAPPRSLFTGGPLPSTNAQRGQERSDYQVIVNTSYPRCHDPHAIVFHSVYGERGDHIEHSELYGTPNPYYSYDCQFVQMLADYAFFRHGVNREDFHPTLTDNNNLVAEGPPFKSIYLENRTGHRMYIQQLQATGDRNEYYVGVAVIPPGTKHRIVKIRNATIQLEYTWESIRTQTTYAALIKCPNDAALSSGRLPDCLLNQTPDRPYGLVISGTEDGGFKFLIHRSSSDYW